MALYLIGDVQGCFDPLQRLLQKLDFSPSRDTLVVLGDLVNRGPDSLAVLRQFMAWGHAAECLLGNHDLHLLAVAHGARKLHRSDTLTDILQAPDASALLDWVRQRPLALQRNGWLLVHAGVLPQWTAAQTLSLADEVGQVLRGPDGAAWLHQMYGNQPDCWRDDRQGSERWRVIVNALTRLRLCTAHGAMDFAHKGPAADAPSGLMPWFDVPARCSAATPIAFGHWSALGLLQRPHLLGLDSGCLWGGQLSAARIDPSGEVAEIIQVPGLQSQG